MAASDRLDRLEKFITEGLKWFEPSDTSQADSKAEDADSELNKFIAKLSQFRETVATLQTTITHHDAKLNAAQHTIRPSSVLTQVDIDCNNIVKLVENEFFPDIEAIKKAQAKAKLAADFTALNKLAAMLASKINAGIVRINQLAPTLSPPESLFTIPIYFLEHPAVQCPPDLPKKQLNDVYAGINSIFDKAIFVIQTVNQTIQTHLQTTVLTISTPARVMQQLNISPSAQAIPSSSANTAAAVPDNKADAKSLQPAVSAHKDEFDEEDDFVIIRGKPSQ